MYEVTLDGHEPKLVSDFDARIAVINHILDLTKYGPVRVEYFPTMKTVPYTDIPVQYWHVFAEDGYHLIEVKKVIEN